MYEAVSATKLLRGGYLPSGEPIGLPTSGVNRAFFSASASSRSFFLLSFKRLTRPSARMTRSMLPRSTTQFCRCTARRAQACGLLSKKEAALPSASAPQWRTPIAPNAWAFFDPFCGLLLTLLSALGSIKVASRRRAARSAFSSCFACFEVSSRPFVVNAGVLPDSCCNKLDQS